jgi:hypothetical protein
LISGGTVLSSLNPFSSKGKRTRAILREAKRRGMTVEELRETLTLKELSDIIDNAVPRPELTRWGLVPPSELVDKPSTGVPVIDAATGAAAAGDWKPAAELLADSFGRWDFRACAVASLAGVAADDDGWLAAWRAAEPENQHTEVVDCAALTALAWQIRGTRRAEETPAEQFRGFRRTLERAETVANRATRVLPDDPTPWSTLVTVARGIGYDNARFDEVWQGLTERAPLHRRAHQSALQYRCAKWHGSHEQMFAFAEHAAGLSPALSMLVVQAAFEKDDDDAKVWHQPSVREALDTFLRWLETEGADNPDLRADLGWAALALVQSGRGAEAIPIFKQLGPHAGAMPWSLATVPSRMFHSYRVRACKAGDVPG